MPLPPLSAKRNKILTFLTANSHHLFLYLPKSVILKFGSGFRIDFGFPTIASNAQKALTVR